MNESTWKATAMDNGTFTPMDPGEAWYNPAYNDFWKDQANDPNMVTSRPGDALYREMVSDE